MNLFKDQAVKLRKTESAIAGILVAAMLFGAVCMTLEMIDKAAVRGSVRVCTTK